MSSVHDKQILFKYYILLKYYSELSSHTKSSLKKILGKLVLTIDRSAWPDTNNFYSYSLGARISVSLSDNFKSLITSLRHDCVIKCGFRPRALRIPRQYSTILRFVPLHYVIPVMDLGTGKASKWGTGSNNQ